jgi:hypothetical protein
MDGRGARGRGFGLGVLLLVPNKAKSGKQSFRRDGCCCGCCCCCLFEAFRCRRWWPGKGTRPPSVGGGQLQLTPKQKQTLSQSAQAKPPAPIQQGPSCGRAQKKRPSRFPSPPRFDHSAAIPPAAQWDVGDTRVMMMIMMASMTPLSPSSEGKVTRRFNHVNDSSTQRAGGGQFS